MFCRHERLVLTGHCSRIKLTLFKYFVIEGFFLLVLSRIKLTLCQYIVIEGYFFNWSSIALTGHFFNIL